jgi:hypothetical protein
MMVTSFEETETLVLVAAVAAAAQTVRLVAKGDPPRATVDERVQRLEAVKRGDEVVIRHTEALALRLDT